MRSLERWNGDAESKRLEGWLLRVAHNIVIDALRRDQKIIPFPEEGIGIEQPDLEVDDELRLVFFCCHPILPRAAQIALTLHVVFGFSTAQIARAFLSEERTVAQRIVRANDRFGRKASRSSFPSIVTCPRVSDRCWMCYTSSSPKAMQLLTARPASTTLSAMNHFVSSEC